MSSTPYCASAGSQGGSAAGAIASCLFGLAAKATKRVAGQASQYAGDALTLTAGGIPEALDEFLA
jgi:phage gp46-like protein